jgi:hypothetical protein
LSSSTYGLYILRHAVPSSFPMDVFSQEIVTKFSPQSLSTLPYTASEITMDFSGFEHHTGGRNYMPIDLCIMQQNGLYELHHPVDRQFEGGGGEYAPAGSMVPAAVCNDPGRQFYSERETTKWPASSADGSYLPLPTSYMGGRFVPRKKAAGNSLKKASIVRGQWTQEEDR